MTVYVSQASLTTALGADGLAKVASPIWSLDAAAVARIGSACDDANALVDKEISGLNFDLTVIPASLIAIAQKLVLPQIFGATWNPLGVKTPQGLLDDAKDAATELAGMKSGDTRPDGTTPARQVVGSFSSTNIGDNASDSNPRQTTRSRMYRLP